ncbi:MAG: translation initiation factor IF-2 [Deltaproteobacteria bacterium]|nr:translation initiation factor IF-2 [Deltaproteobacteria bacterium]
MTEKENTKTAQSDSPPRGGVEEKRIKPAVIRRRAAVAEKPAPEKKEEKEAPAHPVASSSEKPEAEAKVKEKKTSVKEAAGQPAGLAGEKKTARAKAGAKKTSRAALEKGVRKIEAEVPAAQAPAAAKAPEEKPAKVHKREVKIFGKETKGERIHPPRQVFRKGRHYELREGSSRKQALQTARPLKKTEITVPSAEKRVIKIEEAISVAEFSQRIGVKASEIIKRLMGRGILATVNHLIDADSAALVAQEYGYEIENVAVQEEALFEAAPAEAVPVELKPRAPVVTVMGHVDHGKTSLLDAIRRTNVASVEAGGITQHIGAYHVHLDRGDITFLDTPGHEAFTAMRARGAKVTDLVVLVVAADDGVMPQTVEAINHARAAGVPIIVAVNKVDLPQAEPQRVKQALTEYGLVPEDWGGEAIFVEVSAKKGIKIKELLEMILLQSEMLELKASPSIPAKGVIIEAKLDKGLGPVSTVLIQNGTLRVGDACVAGLYSGRLRAMISDWGKRISEAGPSMPVEVLGLAGVPEAGDTFSVVKDEATARQIAAMRQRKAQERERLKTAKVNLADLYERIKKGEVRELSVVVKADVQGSIEAVKDALGKLSSDKIGLKVIHGAVGGINEGDVMLAAASNAIIIGFNVRPEAKARALAEGEIVDVRFYNVIYNLVDDVKNAMEGMLAPVVREEVLGRAEIREVFKVSKVGSIAGCYVTDGKIVRNSKVRLIRDNVVVYDGKVSSLKRFKEDAREVQAGYECGVSIEGYNDIKAGDVIEAYELKEEAARL